MNQDRAEAYHRLGRESALRGLPARPPHASPGTEAYWRGRREALAEMARKEKVGAKGG